jgi:uncharacterized protein involved in exopolysaccharide biosynthesis
MVNAQLSELTDRSLLERAVAGIMGLGVRMTAVEDSLATANAALVDLKADIAAEVAQVAAALTATQDVAAAVAGLNAISAGLTEQSAVLEADDPVPPVA